METTEIIGCTLFESENYGGWKILTDKLIPTIRANKVCSGIIEVIHMGKTDKINIGGYLEMEGWHRLANEVLLTDGVSTDVTCKSNNLLKKIIEVKKVDYFQMPQTVRVRKYSVDTNKLCKLLRQHRVLTNNELAEKLGVPLTKVEHWFRQDSSFAIPDENIWFKLKDLLNIQTNEFDESIMTFYEKPGVFEKGERIYNPESIDPTVLTGNNGEKIIEIRKMNDNKTNFLGNLHGHGQGYAGAVFDSNDLAPTITTMQGGGRQPNILEIKKMDIEKLGHLEKGTGEHQSNIIYNSDGLSPCVCAGIGVKQQPTMTVETKIIGNLDENSNQRKQVYEKDMIAPALQAAMGNGGGNVPLIEEERLIIQKCGDRDKDGNYSVHNYSNCIPSNPMSNRDQMLLEKSIVAMRGRNPENPSDRTAGIHLEQRLEQNTEGISNTLTSVQKDNLVLEKNGIHVGDFFGIIETEKVDALRMVRTEEGKVLRKSYENGELHHGFNEYRTEEPRNDGCTNNLSTVQKDNKLLETKKIKIRQATKEGFIDCEIGGVCDLNYPTSQTRRGRVQENGQVSPTLTTESIPSVLELADPEFYNFLYLIDEEIYMIRIRKLIPLECWRLMNFSDEDFFKAQKVNSNTQLYKQAGNSIVINVLVAILGNLFEGKEKIYMNNILR